MRQSRQGGAASRQAQGHLSARRVEVVRTYLALESAAQLRPSGTTDPAARIELHSPCPVPLYRELYRDVGGPWFWHDRLAWTDEDLARHLASPRVSVWVLRVGAECAGYFELYRHDDGAVSIDYFGLIPAFIGRGLGGLLLTRAAREAFAMGAGRVWLHTCTLDSPNALPAYRARGFREYRTERLLVEIDGTRVVSERMLPD